MKVKLLDFKELKNFPSGSAIEYYNEKIYLVGDDARELLILNKRWKEAESLSLFPREENEPPRIPKKVKPDLEASTVVEINSIPRLLVLGSGSREKFRSKALLVNLDDLYKEEFDVSAFYERLKPLGMSVINIESAAIIMDKLILGNRGHKAAPDNHAIITSHEFWKDQETAEISTLKFDLPEPTQGNFAGISGMAYAPENDWLLFTMSTENTDNAEDDGEIGDSYLCIVENAAWKIGRKKIKVNHQLNLGQIYKWARGYKIESVCIQSEKVNRVKIHLVADNDTGVTYLFKAVVKI
ncbi:MAG: hypothetical protein QM731_07535 [Chitinophagaceae bacterium]